MKALITDLDNTLYDWVTYFATAFEAMLDELQVLLGVPRSQLIAEFRVVNQRAGSSEAPHSALRLPSVLAHFGRLEPQALVGELRRPFGAFNDARERTLRLYDGVEPALRTLRKDGFTVIGHTEAAAINAYHRLRLLGIDNLIDRLYVQDATTTHLDPQRQAEMIEAQNKIRLLTPGERKPARGLLLDICRQESLHVDATWYVGDSLTRDITMAHSAGIKSIWAKYGTKYDPRLWELLVSVTHWTNDDVASEATLRDRLPGVRPDFTVSSFAEIPSIVGLETERLGRGSGALHYKASR
jgi:FMN phosphatase YigB (HAD superfamily)